MQPIKIPEFPRSRGEKAIKTLYDFMNELEEQRGKELTDKRTISLIRLAKGLISSIEAEKRAGTSNKDIKQIRFVSQLRKTIMKYTPEIIRAHEKGKFWKLPR